MGDFDDLYERNLVDGSGIPLWSDDAEKQLNSNQYNISLTSSEYLFSNGLTVGSEESTRDKIDKLQYAILEIQHDIYNHHDKYALKVLYENTMIGYIKKDQNIHSKCFDSNGFLKDITIKKKDYKYTLTINSDTCKYNTYYEKAYKVLYFYRKTRPLKTELETINHVISNRNSFHISEEEYLILAYRRDTLRIKNTGKLIGKATNMTLGVAEGTFSIAESIVKGVFKLFK
jgi:hypothetical protein